MTVSTVQQRASTATEPSSESLGTKRTRLAYDRTLMAWIRTSVSLISFGFTIYKFFDLTGFKPSDANELIGPRLYAAGMIVTGLGALAFAIFDNTRGMRALAPVGTKLRGRMPVRWVAWAVVGLGAFAMAAVVFNQ